MGMEKVFLVKGLLGLVFLRSIEGFAVKAMKETASKKDVISEAKLIKKLRDEETGTS